MQSNEQEQKALKGTSIMGNGLKPDRSQTDHGNAVIVQNTHYTLIIADFSGTVVSGSVCLDLTILSQPTATSCKQPHAINFTPDFLPNKTFIAMLYDACTVF